MNTNKDLNRFNPVMGDASLLPLLAEVFEQQVQQTPDAVALEWEDRTLTYRQLLERSQRLASLLAEHGVRKDDMV